jgi:hypothetical protein
MTTAIIRVWYARAADNGEVLTLHPKTGNLVRESSLRWPEDYPAREVADNLRDWYGVDARKRAVELGVWEAAMLLEERFAQENSINARS